MKWETFYQKSTTLTSIVPRTLFKFHIFRETVLFLIEMTKLSVWMECGDSKNKYFSLFLIIVYFPYRLKSLFTTQFLFSHWKVAYVLLQALDDTYKISFIQSFSFNCDCIAYLHFELFRVYNSKKIHIIKVIRRCKEVKISFQRKFTFFLNYPLYKLKMCITLYPIIYKICKFI